MIQGFKICLASHHTTSMRSYKLYRSALVPESLLSVKHQYIRLEKYHEFLSFDQELSDSLLDEFSVLWNYQFFYELHQWLFVNFSRWTSENTKVGHL